MNWFLVFCLSAFSTALFADEDLRTLFQSAMEASPNKSTQLKWRSVNDNVMGGLSDGQAKINRDKKLEFYGNLSLENNGGFASIRTLPTELKLDENETIIIKVKGDGRRYFLNLYVPTRQIAFSYRTPFQTIKDKWMEIRLPINKFYATSFGRKVNRKLDANAVESIGFLLADKKPGQFKLEIEWMKVGKVK